MVHAIHIICTTLIMINGTDIQLPREIEGGDVTIASTITVDSSSTICSSS